MDITNRDVKEIITEIPEGHKHLRTTLIFEDGKSMTLQEATVANLVRSYITIKTHPTLTRTILKRTRPVNRKDGYAEWQLLESEQ
jgi:hypothetical protein